MPTRSSDAALLESDPLVRAFETATLDPTMFHHREHLYVAWMYLRALPLEDALARFMRHLRALVRALNAERKLHVTLSWAYVLLIHEAMRRDPDASFEQLAARNPALFDHSSGFVAAQYPPGALETDAARSRFIWPVHVA